MAKETYYELKEHLNGMFNALPIKHCGFSSTKAEATEGLKAFAKEWGFNTLTEFYESVVHIGHGLCIRKADMHLLDEWIERGEREWNEFYASDDNVIAALEYEFRNKECQIGGSWDEALNATGLTREECVRNGRDLYKEAYKRFWDWCYKNDAF